MKGGTNLIEDNVTEPFSFGPTLIKYEYLRITDTTEIPIPTEVLTIKSEIIAANGDIFTLSGASKSGKSAVIGMAISGAITENGIINDGIDGMEVSPNQSRKAVLHFDTEQARHKHQYNVRSIIKRADLDSCPAHYLSYNIRQLDIKEYAVVTNEICEVAVDAFGGIHSIWIDGGADYVADTNDQERSNEVVKYFETLAIKYDTAVFLVVHTNPGSDKERGHFGSQCQRKSGGILQVKNEGGLSYIEAKFLRYAGTNDIPQLIFNYDKDKGYHVGAGIRSKSDDEEAKIQAKINKAFILCNKIFGGQKSYKYAEAISAIMKARVCSERTAKNDFKTMKSQEMILKGTVDNWRLNYDYTNEI